MLEDWKINVLLNYNGMHVSSSTRLRESVHPNSIHLQVLPITSRTYQWLDLVSFLPFRQPRPQPNDTRHDPKYDACRHQNSDNVPCSRPTALANVKKGIDIEMLRSVRDVGE